MVSRLNPLRAAGSDTAPLIDGVREISYPLDTSESLDRLLDLIGEARYVLLGEATHGTSEFYLWRARISQRLIHEKGFNFIAVEGDWPDCYRLNRYIRGYPDSGESAAAVLREFQRWPTWMWANWEVAALADWMRYENTQGAGRRGRNVSFYGLDVYSLRESMESIIGYLREKDPQVVELAYQAYRCFEPYGGGEDVQAYAWSTRMVPDTCEDEVVELLMELRRRENRYEGDDEMGFSAEQNALVMVNAERYYREMVRSDSNSWNVRDRHMMETLNRLMDFHGPQAKGIVWAHNTHVGDARFTDMQHEGMVNIGQLTREEHADEGVVLVGFGAHRGTVIAAEEWGAPVDRMLLPEARPGSWEDVLHQAGGDRLLLLKEKRGSELLRRERGHRAVG